MSLAQGYSSTFSNTEGTNTVLHNLDNETKKIYNDINTFMAANGHAHTGNGSDGAKISIGDLSVNAALNEALGAPIASAATINLTTATGNFLHITGTTTITAVTLGAGMRREVIFDGILTLTHHATNNNLPGAANITTAAGDRASYCSDGTTVYCTKYERASGQAIVYPSVAGEILQLKITNNTTTPNAKMDITANNVPMYDASYNPKKSGVISLTADLGVSGVNGLDTGTKANSTNYFLWVIGKEDGTIASLWSLSSTSPAMPTGYTYKRRVGWNRTDSSGNIYRILQKGSSAQYVVTSSTNTPSLPAMASGTAGNTSTPVWVAVSVNNFIPTTAKSIGVLPLITAITSTVLVAPNNSYTGVATGCIQSGNTTQGGVVAAVSVILLESSNIYWASANSTNYLLCQGWEDNI